MKRYFLVYSNEMFGNKKVLKCIEYFINDSGKCCGAYFFQVSEVEIGGELCRDYERLPSNANETIWMLKNRADIESVEEKQFNIYPKKMQQKGRSFVRSAENPKSIHSIDLIIKDGVCIGAHQCLEMTQAVIKLADGAYLKEVYVKELNIQKVEWLIGVLNSYEALLEFTDRGNCFKRYKKDDIKFVAYPLYIGMFSKLIAAVVYKYEKPEKPEKVGFISSKEYESIQIHLS